MKNYFEGLAAQDRFGNRPVGATTIRAIAFPGLILSPAALNIEFFNRIGHNLPFGRPEFAVIEHTLWILLIFEEVTEGGFWSCI